MPVWPRHGSTSACGTILLLGRRGTLSLIGIVGVLSAAGPRIVLEVEAFLFPGNCLGGFDAGAAALPRRVAAVSQLGRPREGRFLLGRERAGAAGLRANMDDEDEEFVVDMDAYNFDEEDDSGMGVSNTIKNKKRRKPRPEEVAGFEEPNVILELTEAAQEVVDSLLPDDEFDKYKRKEPKDEPEEEEEDDSGMGVSETVSAPEAKAVSITDDSTARAVALAQGVDQVEERAAMARKEAQRSQMMEKGLSREQIAAYLGDDLSVVKKPKTLAEIKGDRNLAKFQAAVKKTDAWRDELALLRVAPSSSLVKVDQTGKPYIDRFVYVDEYTCIGCTHCSHTAPATFFMEDEHGRARVFQQGKDTDDSVRTAILTCPVDCIHYVDFPELEKLETEREGIDINFKAKLVGNDHDNSRNGQQLISGNQDMRCENCPSRGCYNCPMYGVGNNPEYTKKQAENKMRRKARLQEQKDQRGDIRTADL